MIKKKKYAIYGAVAGGVGNGVLNIINQLNENPNEPINWSRVFKAVGKGAVVIGAGGFVVGAYKDYNNSKQIPLNTDSILSDLVNDLRLTDHDKKYLRLCAKADWLIGKIRNKYGMDFNGEPFRFGSTEDGTALKEKYDIDVSISFKADAFVTIADMYLLLEDFLKKFVGINGITLVRRQNVSIGVFFNIGGNSVGKVDIVPIKITKRRGNKTSGYIHKNGSGLFATDSYQKTDASLLSRQQLSKSQKEILIALKKWKRTEMVPISSHLLQNLIKDAYACNVNRVPHGITKKIIMILTHIRDYIESIHLTSVENTNNVLTDISPSDKTAIRIACKKIIKEFEYQPNSIIDYFSK